jgi:hypothetical protein
VHVDEPPQLFWPFLVSFEPKSSIDFITNLDVLKSLVQVGRLKIHILSRQHGRSWVICPCWSQTTTSTTKRPSTWIRHCGRIGKDAFRSRAVGKNREKFQTPRALKKEKWSSHKLGHLPNVKWWRRSAVLKTAYQQAHSDQSIALTIHIFQKDSQLTWSN